MAYPIYYNINHESNIKTIRIEQIYKTQKYMLNN